MRAEFDHRVGAAQDLLTEVAATRRMLEAQSSDSLPGELCGDAKELVRPPPPALFPLSPFPRRAL